MLGDTDGDGRADMVVISSRGVGSVFLGQGGGRFRPPRAPFALGTGPRSVATGDMDGDGRLDLVFIDIAAGDIGVLLGNGDGTFQAPHHFATST